MVATGGPFIGVGVKGFGRGLIELEAGGWVWVWVWTGCLEIED